MLTLDWAASVHHDGSPQYVTFVHDSHTAVPLRLRIASNAPVERVARHTNDGLAPLSIHHGAIADGTYLIDILTGTETTINNGQISLQGLPDVGTQV